MELLNKLTTYFVPIKPQLSKKLPDIPEYEREELKLDDGEQKFIQKIDVNNDCFFTNWYKIAYTENCLALSKKTHNLIDYH